MTSATAGDGSRLTLSDIEDNTGPIRAFKDEVVNSFGQPAPQPPLGAGPDWAFARVSFIASFLRAAWGFGDGLPIRYPRTRQTGQVGNNVPPQGNGYEWFDYNARSPAPVNLPDLRADQGLRYFGPPGVE